jgi:hypothetical protein
VEKERIMSEGSSGHGRREISLGDWFGTTVVQGGGIKVELSSDGTIDVYTNGAVKVHPAANDDTKSKAAHEIGAIESDGDHKGEIYGGIYPADNKPIWFSAAPRLMDHYTALAWASGSLPTRKQGNYLTTLKGKGGAFTEIFNRGSSFPAGYVWLAEPSTGNRHYAWCQRLSDGDQGFSTRNVELPVLSVRR